jgi:hypothetical protein
MGGQNYAAVVQAQPGASDSALKSMFKEIGKGFGGELAKRLTQAMSGQQQY